MSRRPSELSIILLIAAVQFVNILDFMMVMPLGPDFARALGIAQSHIGIVAGSYTASAAVAGLVGALFLDRFDRRVALGWAMVGLVIGTAAGGFAQGLPSLVAARVIAGAFGGPATALSFSIIADLIPPERRGKAMGMVMGAFSVASVLGVPGGLELATLGSWRTPFFVVAGLGAVVAGGAIFALPPLTLHLAAQKRAQAGFAELARRPLAILSWTLTAVVMMAGFIVIPNISPYLQTNVGFPREKIGGLYMAGGVVSFFATQAAGRLVDKLGAFRTALMGSVVLIAITWAGFVAWPPVVAPVIVFIFFMLAMSLRNVAYNTLCTRVPELHERARFLSTQSAVQHFSSAAAAFLSASILTETGDHLLVGMDRVGEISIALSITVPFVMYFVERGVKAKEALHSSRPEPAPNLAPAPAE